MVQSNYTVSTAHQLLGRMPAVRVSGSKAKSSGATATSETAHVKAVDQPSRAPTPTRPLPPTPLNTVRVRASRSSNVLSAADKITIKTDIPPVVSEDKILTLPATVYTPTTPRAKSNSTTLAFTTGETASVPVLETPRKGRDSAVVDKRISQYYEYITPPVSLDLGRSGSRRERKASHTPTSSAGSDIYFSPIDATNSQVFLSSPQPSPPITPSDRPPQDTPVASYEDGLVEKAASLAIEPSKARQPEMVESAGIGASIQDGKMTLTLAHVDRVTLALAQAPLVQLRVRGSHFDTITQAVTSKTSGIAEDEDSNTTPTALPTPPPSEASVCDEFGGIALIDTNVEGAPVTLASTDAFTPGKCTHLSLPYGLSTTSRLRIEPALISNAESKIILQSLFVTLDRKTNARDLTLLAETDVTPSFARAALTELAEAHNLTLDDLEIRTPIAPCSPDESIDWCNLDEEDAVAPVTSPVTNVLDEITSSFASTLSAETCTMQTLTLLSELARLQTAHRTFLILQPTRFDAQGGLAAVKIPLISTALRQRFEQMGGNPSSGSSTGSDSAIWTPSVNGGSKGRAFREAIIAAVGPRFKFGEEFETFVVLEGGKVRVRARCVPLAAGEVIEKWVCFLGGEYDVPY